MWIDENRFYGVSDIFARMGISMTGVDKKSKVALLKRYIRVLGLRIQVRKGYVEGRSVTGLRGRDFAKFYRAWEEFQHEMMLFAWKGTKGRRVRRFLNGGGA